jgi:hypothetical protein
MPPRFYRRRGLGFKPCFIAFVVRPDALRSCSGLQLVACLLQFGGEGFFVRQRGEVLADEQLVGQGVGGVAHQRLAFGRAEDDADGRILAELDPVFAGVDRR